MRPRIHVFIAVSLDGLIARDDGSVDWLARVETPGEDYGFAAFLREIDACVMGRATWDAVRAMPAWPFDGKRVIVLTHGALHGTHGEQTHAGELGPLFERLGREGVRRVYLDGGATIRCALSEGLVDELTISTIPIVLGNGRPLFETGLPEVPLRLVASRAFASGLVQSTYVRV